MTDEQRFEHYRMLNRDEDIAQAKYLKLRDDKSNGCCAGMPLSYILDYDRKIQAAFDELQIARTVCRLFVEQHWN